MIQKLKFYSYYSKEVGTQRSFDGSERRVDDWRKWTRFRGFRVKIRRRQPPSCESIQTSLKTQPG